MRALARVETVPPAQFPDHCLDGGLGRDGQAGAVLAEELSAVSNTTPAATDPTVPTVSLCG